MPSKFIPIGVVLFILLYIVALTLDSMGHAEQPRKSYQQLLDEMRVRQQVKLLLHE